MTYGVGWVCTGVGWGHRDSHFLKLIKKGLPSWTYGNYFSIMKQREREK